MTAILSFLGLEYYSFGWVFCLFPVVMISDLSFARLVVFAFVAERVGVYMFTNTVEPLGAVLFERP